MNNENQIQDNYHYDELEIDLVELFLVVWRSKWFIIGLTIVVMLSAIVFGLLQEEVYEVSVTFAFSSQNYVTTMGESQNERQNLDIGILLSILNSNRLIGMVVEDLNLIQVWEVESLINAINNLKNAIKIDHSNNENVITIRYQNSDPQLAKDIVDSYVNNFVQINQEVNSTEASQALAFVESRLTEVEEELNVAQNELQSFQNKYQIFSFEDQKEALTEAYTELNSELRSLRIDYNVKKETYSANNPELKSLKKEISEYEEQLTLLKKGQKDLENNNVADVALQSSNVTIGVDDISSVGLRLSELRQEVNIQEKNYELLRSQLESLKIEAAKTNNIVRIIDPPTFPEKPLGRNLKLNGAIGGMLGFMVAVFITFVVEFFKNRDWDEEVLKEFPLLKKFNK